MKIHATQGFAPFDFHLGTLWVACSKYGIVRSSLDEPATKIDRLPSRFHEAVMAALASGDSTTLQFDLDNLNSFTKEVLTAVCHIPPGRTETYSSLATVLGRPRAARAVGNAVGANPIPVLIPCHRVIRSNGELGGYAWGAEIKRMLLSAEGSSVPASTPRLPPRLFHTKPNFPVVPV